MREDDLTIEQSTVLHKIREWRAGHPWGDSLTMTVGGYAGTGKTTLIAHLIGGWEDVAVVALCGKAAHVLRQKGVEAQTVHSLIYLPFENAEGKICYRKRDYLKDVSTIIVDEASMIDHLLHQDLLSFGIPILWVGDHGQLEPVGGQTNLMANPTLRLEHIHRQAADNPILRLAHAFREGRATPFWEDPKGRLTLTDSSYFDKFVCPERQIICGYNKTRHRVNKKVREQLNRTDLVEPGEKLICLRNSKRHGVFNGQQFTVVGILGETRRIIEVEVETDDYQSMTLPLLKKQFGVEVLKDYKPKDVVLADYGYCITAHKSQGSEYSSVLAIEELAPAWNPKRWRYTVATRAKEQLIYCV